MKNWKTVEESGELEDSEGRAASPFAAVLLTNVRRVRALSPSIASLI
jgi:hypothetical protein